MSQVRTVDGTVSIRERIALPAGAVATVKLVDPTGEVLAAAAVEAPGVPARFSLTLDPGLTPAADGLQLWAVLRSDVGVWGTLQLAPVADGAETDVVLTRIED